MKKLLLLISFSITSIGLHAQGLKNVGANIVIETGAYMHIDGNANGRYTNESSGANHGEIDLDGTLYVEGDWLNNANAGNVFINNTSAPWGTVNFNGSIAQNIGGTRNTHFENLYVTNSTKTLTADNIEVNNQLRLVSGDIDLNEKVLIIDNGSSGNLFTTGGYGLISESTSTFGILQWNIGSTTASDFVIPFIDGVGGTEIPYIFRPNTGTTGSIKVATYNTAVNNTPLAPTVNHLKDAATGGDNSAVVADRFFMLDVSGTGVNADITFTTTPSEASATTNPRAQRWLAADDGWEGPLGIQTNPTANSTKVTGLTNFNTWWVLAPAANPLPIELLSFQADCHNNKATLTWSTATETNNDFFTIEKTMDGITFETVAIIPGAGNSNKTLHYSIVDNSSLAHPTYYRLKQTDYNGNSETFKMVNVKPCNTQTNWGLIAIQGQASTVRVTLQSSVNEIVDMEIFDILGNKISENQIELFGGYQAEQLEVKNLLPGIYVGTAKTSSELQTLKFVVKN